MKFRFKIQQYRLYLDGIELASLRSSVLQPSVNNSGTPGIEEVDSINPAEIDHEDEDVSVFPLIVLARVVHQGAELLHGKRSLRGPLRLYLELPERVRGRQFIIYRIIEHGADIPEMYCPGISGPVCTSQEVLEVHQPFPVYILKCPIFDFFVKLPDFPQRLKIYVLRAGSLPVFHVSDIYLEEIVTWFELIRIQFEQKHHLQFCNGLDLPQPSGLDDIQKRHAPLVEDSAYLDIQQLVVRRLQNSSGRPVPELGIYPYPYRAGCRCSLMDDENFQRSRCASPRRTGVEI